MYTDVLEKIYFDNDIKLDEKELKNCIQVIDSTEIEGIVSFIINNHDRLKVITKSNIPQFSDFDAIGKVLLIVESATGQLDYRRIGYYFNKDNNDNAQRKYGENHYKLSASLQLVSESKPYKISPIYEEIKNRTEKEKQLFYVKMALGIPVIQHILVIASSEKIDVVEYLNSYLSSSTAIRRGSSVKKLLELILNAGNGTEIEQIKKNLGWN